MSKKPAEVASLTVLIPVALLVMVTLAWGTTAPVESMTVPSRDPSPAVCAAAGIAVTARQSARASIAKATQAQAPLRFSSVVIDFRSVFIGTPGMPPLSESVCVRSSRGELAAYLLRPATWKTHTFRWPDQWRSDLSQALEAFPGSIVNRKIIFFADSGGRT